MPVPQITALPDPPSRQDPTNFAVKGDAFLGALPDFATEANALATQVNERVDAAFDAGLEGAATNAATTVTKAAEARASELAAAGFANEAMLLSLGVETLRPSIKPSLLLDFARAQVVPPSVTFTRASTATRVGPSGLIETVGINVPRLDYDPITRACLGLLVEEQRTNEAWPSEPSTASTRTGPGSPAGYGIFDATFSTQSRNGIGGLNIIPDTTIDINGFTGIGSVPFAGLHYGRGATASLKPISFFINPLDWNFSIYAGVLATDGNPTFANNASSHVLLFNNGQYVGPPNLLKSIFSDGTYWISGLIVSNSGTSTGVLIHTRTAGDGMKKFWFGGLQQESTGAFSTSYIPTTTASATRAADTAVLSTLSPWYRADEGTLYLEGAHFLGASVNSGIDLRDTTANKVTLRNSSAIVGVNSVTEASFSYAGDNGVVSKKAMALKLNDVAVARNGVIVNSDTSVSLPSVSELRFSVDGTSFFYNGHIRQLKYFPQRLINAQLQALTTL